MRIVLLILILTTSAVSNTQLNSSNQNLQRYFFNTKLNFGVHKRIAGWTDYGGGLEVNVGNNWFLKSGKFCGIIRLTWIRLGFMFSDGLYLYAAPANLGLGHRFHMRKAMAFETSMHAGPLFIADDIIQEHGFISYLIMPEFKIHINNFNIGLEYTFRREFNNSNNNLEGRFHYFGLAFGQSFGNI